LPYSEKVIEQVAKHKGSNCSSLDFQSFCLTAKTGLSLPLHCLKRAKIPSSQESFFLIQSQLIPPRHHLDLFLKSNSRRLALG
jgi:hypothetical protein